MKVWPVIVKAMGSVLLLDIAVLCVFALGYDNKHELGGLIPVMLLCIIFSAVTFVLAIDGAVKLRNWVDPAKEMELKSIIPEFAVDCQWVLAIEKAMNEDYQEPEWPGEDVLTIAEKRIRNMDKKNKILQLIYAAKNAGGQRIARVTMKE